MSKPEIELKLPIPDPAAFQALVHALGFRIETPRTFEHNTLYDTPSRDLRARTEILRIRRYGDTWTLTHKRLADPGSSTSDPTRYKTRIETETTVADGEALADVFTHLGYKPAFTYEKFRTEWSHPSEPSAHLVLDETPIGTYAELEGPTDWIDRTVNQLGIDPSTCLTDSYGKLFLDWKQRTGSPADNLTFSEIAPALA
jgi:adenylate cyclase class 2